MELADAWMLDQPIWQAMWGGGARNRPEQSQDARKIPLMC